MININRNNLGYGVAVWAVFMLLIVFPNGWNALLTANGFIPHGHCYLWKPGLVWLHVLSDLLIALAYVAISATLAYLVYRTRQEIPFHWMFLAFGSFIVACGSTHFMEVWTLWHPIYWLSGALKVVTAIASVTTALILPFLVPRALALIEAAKLSEERQLHLETANDQLAALNEQLKEVDQLKTRFFANISHELRTPLALILGPVEKLLKHRELDQEQRHDLEVVDRNAHLLLKQVNDLLDIAKLEASKMALNAVQVDLAQLVRLTAANFDGLAQEKQITFTVDAPESLLVQIDAAKVQRILLNLLSNAFKFTPDGGIVRCTLAGAALEAQPSPAPVDQLAQQAEQIMLSVRDSGPGVPVELRQTIFERFSQAGGTTRRFGGTGLGLAIVKEFVELQGGKVIVGDADEGGAQFTVELPLVATDAVVLASTSASTSASTAEFPPRIESADLVIAELRPVVSTQLSNQSGQTHDAEKPLVLVVEDNPEMNQFITKTLASEYRTATAANGEEGLAQALMLQPDLILSDMMMPNLSGEQLVQQIRTYPQLHSTPIVMLTAIADDEMRMQLLRQGVQDYLMKPFAVEELQARVGNLIAIKRVRNLLQQELDSQSQDIKALVAEVSLQRRQLQEALNILQRQAEELEQANRAKDEFLAIVSHELRTPLNAILGWAQMLRIRKFDQTTTDRALETIERNARLQTEQVEKLLDISRLLRGQLPLYKQPVDVRPIVEAAIQTIHLEATTKLIQLNYDLANDHAQVFADPDRIRQVIETLLSNAIKFTPQGGRVEVRLDQQQGEARIQVSDTGQGIAAEVLPHIFDCFRQADSSDTRKYGGLGLGLAIAYRLVELHDGEIQVESQGEGRGAIFTLSLPLIATSSTSLCVH
jgi:signal transduction histidine kinase